MATFMGRMAWLAGLGLMINAAFAVQPAAVLPGGQPDGSTLLPNQWSLRPAGRQIPVGDFPVNIALHPGGRYAAVLHSGYGTHEVRIIDLAQGTEVSRTELKLSYYGLAWSPDGEELFVSGGAGEVVHVFAFQDGKLSARRELALRPSAEEGVPAGLAVSAAGRAV